MSAETDARELSDLIPRSRRFEFMLAVLAGEEAKVQELLR